jgi:hypothetical protein
MSWIPRYYDKASRPIQSVTEILSRQKIEAAIAKAEGRKP